MFLDYFALGLLCFVALVLFYGIIAIHDIPYEIAPSAATTPSKMPSTLPAGLASLRCMSSGLFFGSGRLSIGRTAVGAFRLPRRPRLRHWPS